MNEIKYIDWNSEKENLERMINKEVLTLDQISEHYHVSKTKIKSIIKSLGIIRTSSPKGINDNRSYSDEQLKTAVESSKSIAETLRKLNLRDLGGNYATVKNQISRLQLNTDHFTGQIWNKGKTKDGDGINCHGSANLEDIFSNKVSIRASHLRERLINASLKKAECECCHNTEWNGKPIPLELHHKDGNHNNNSFDNLQILCPNCHAQTDYYRGKGISKLNYKLPNKSELLNKLRECKSVKNLAKFYDVSESTVRVWVKKNDMKEDWEKTLKEIKKP